jgi:hypothetical protein
MLKLSGFPPIGANTPTEYSDKLWQKAGRFFPEKDTLSALTNIFVEVCYGGEAPGENDYKQFLRAYKGFPATCKKYLGLPRYIRIFFRT